MALHSRPKRLAEEIRSALSDIIHNELKDPRFALAMVTVTHVEVTNDLRHSTAWISILANDEDTRAILEGLSHSRNYIKRLLGERVVMKYMPDLHFKLDESGRHADRINRLLKQIERTTPPRPEENEEEKEKSSG